MIKDVELVKQILEELDRLEEPYFVGYIDKYKVKEIIINHLNDNPNTTDEQLTIPNDNGDWIPCSKRMPEEHDSTFAIYKDTHLWSDAMFEKKSDVVNVTIELKDGIRKTMSSYTIDGKWKCEKNSVVKMRVIAWRPLPELYKGEETAVKRTKVEKDENNKVPDWVYRDWGNEEEIKMIHLIEKALGFKLFFWQKTYITRGYFRQTGRTTAIIIRILTQGTKPVDLSNDRAIREYLDIDCPKYSAGLACGIFKREVKEIHEKLVRAGIKTNPVFYTKKDKEEFLRRR